MLLGSRQTGQWNPDQTRMPMVERVERLALVARYFALCLGAFLFASKSVAGELSDLIIIMCAVGLHNAYVHWALLSKRTHFFLSPLNFLIHLLDISIVVMFTGAEESHLYVLFFFLLIGYSTYTRNFRKTLLATAICCLAYACIIFFEWHFVGIRMESGIIVLQMLSVAICGWLVGTIAEEVHQVEQDAQEHAQQLAASEATLRTILESTAAPLIAFDDHEFISEVNDSACRFLGVARDKFIGKRFRVFTFDDGTIDNKMSVLRARGEYHGEQVLVTSEGEERTVKLDIRSFVRDLQRFYICACHDITEQKELQETTRQANLNLERLNRELSQLNDLKTQFMTDIAQHLRSPLATILGYTEMLLDDELGSTTQGQREALQTCRRSALRAFSLLDDVLEFREIPNESPGNRAGNGKTT